MATPGDNPTTTPTPLLQRLYETGHHSDLVVHTSTRDFHVHKCVVCEECPFFAGAVRGEWKEAQTGIIEVEEPEVVMDLLFRYMYKIDIEMVPREGDSRQQLVEKGNPENFYLAMSVEAAANKYLLAGIDIEMFGVMYNCELNARVNDSVSFAMSLLERVPEEASYLLILSILVLGSQFDQLLGSTEAWAKLHEAPKLQRIVVQWATANNGVPSSDLDLEMLERFCREAGISVVTMTGADLQSRHQMMALVLGIRKGGD